MSVWPLACYQGTCLLGHEYRTRFRALMWLHNIRRHAEVEAIWPNRLTHVATGPTIDT